MLWFIIVAAGVWCLQGILGFFQVRHFNKHFKQLRTKGRVAVGRSKGRIMAGVVVLFCIDREGNILQAEHMSGISVFARLRFFTAFNGKNLLEINEKSCIALNPQMKKAVLNSVENYRTFIEANNQDGGEAIHICSSGLTIQGIK